MMNEYQHIRNACVYISYANGGVNRNRSIVEVLNTIDRFLENYPQTVDLQQIDEFLSSLSSEEMETLCDGDQDEAEKICSSGPDGVHELLNAYFDIC